MMKRLPVSVCLLLTLIAAPLVLRAAPASYEGEPVGRAELLAEIAAKEQRVLAFMRAEKLGAVLLSRVANVAWITAGIADTHDVLTREAGPVSVLITRDGGKFVLASMSDMPRLVAEDFSGLGYEARPYKWSEDPRVRMARELAGGLAVGSDVPLEGLRSVDAGFAKLRYALTDSEVKKYRVAGRATGEALDEACRRIQPNMSEREIEALVSDALMRRYMRPTVIRVAVDERAFRYRRVTPSNARLKKFARIEVIARRWGLETGATRMVHWGPVPPDLDRRVRACAYVNAHLQDGSRPGVPTPVLFTRMVSWFNEAGFGAEWDQHTQGGAIGYDAYDWLLQPGLEEFLASPQAFAWCPNVEGIMVGDTIVAFRDKIENVTAVPSWPAITVTIGANTFTSPNILALGTKPATPAPTPAATSTPRPTPTMPVAPTPRPRPSVSPSTAPSPTATPTPSPTPKATPSTSPTTPKATPSTPSPTPKATPSSPSPTPKAIPSTSPTTPKATPSASPTTPKPTPSASPTPPKATPSPSSTRSPRPLPTVAPPAPKPSPSTKKTPSGDDPF